MLKFLKLGKNISENLSESLVKLQLPNHSIIYPGFLNSLPKLKYLQYQNGTSNFDLIYQFPQIFINKGNALIANCAKEYFESKFGFWKLKCTDADFLKLKETLFLCIENFYSLSLSTEFNSLISISGIWN